MKNKAITGSIRILSRVIWAGYRFTLGTALLGLGVVTAHAAVSENLPSPQLVQVTITGRVTSGGNIQTSPIAHASVTIFEAHGTSAVAGQGDTNTAGVFTIRVKRSYSDSIFYAQATLGSNLKFMADLGSSPLKTVRITS